VSSAVRSTISPDPFLRATKVARRTRTEIVRSDKGSPARGSAPTRRWCVFDVRVYAPSFNVLERASADSLGSYRFVSIFLTISARSDARARRAAQQCDPCGINFSHVRRANALDLESRVAGLRV